MVRLLTAGESHGKAMVGILEGLPAGIELDEEKINAELTKRQQGYGRGARQQLEKDKIEILSGIRFGKTLGSPIAFMVENKDFSNWKEEMSAFGNGKNVEKITKLRPGHADYPGMVKYGHDDLRNVLERASARSTTAYVAAGAICKQFLASHGIAFDPIVTSLSGIEVMSLTLNAEALKKIDEAKQQGHSLGGIIQTTVTGLPIGLGSYVHYDRKASAKIAGAVLGIPAIKGVEFGLGFDYAGLPGNQAQDVMKIDNGKIVRNTNYAGGLEGGMTNGEPLVVRAVLKPIPTMTNPLPSVDFETLEVVDAHVERADICPIEAAAIVLDNIVAIELAALFCEKIGC